MFFNLVFLRFCTSPKVSFGIFGATHRNSPALLFYYITTLHIIQGETSDPELVWVRWWPIGVRVSPELIVCSNFWLRLAHTLVCSCPYQIWLIPARDKFCLQFGLFGLDAFSGSVLSVLYQTLVCLFWPLPIFRSVWQGTDSTPGPNRQNNGYAIC